MKAEENTTLLKLADGVKSQKELPLLDAVTSLDAWELAAV